MSLRIFQIKGRGEQHRQSRLIKLRTWMEAAGWCLMDYSPELGSAVFERDGNADRLGWLHPTRWLPGPDWYHPREWLAGLFSIPRQVLLAGALGLGVAVFFVALLGLSHSPPPSDLLESRAAGESWRFVKVDALNIRESPADGSQIVGILYRNQKVEVAERQKGWVRIVKPERGFVAEGFLQDYPVE